VPGKQIIWKVDGSCEETDLEKWPRVEEMQRAVGGGFFVEIPQQYLMKNMFQDENGKTQKYRAYCNEAGSLKGFPQNESRFADFLPIPIVGDILVLTGDKKFMRQS
jgi:hypothetical protein